MKWFKHESDASSGEFLSELESKFGMAGYARWFKLLEAIALKMDTSDRCSAAYPVEKWQQILRTKGKILKTFLEHCENKTRISLQYNENIIEIFCPKLLEWRDNYTRDYQEANKKLPSKEVEVEVDTDQELKHLSKSADLPESVKAPKAKPAKIKPAFDFAPIWDLYPRKLGRKAAERHFNASVHTAEDYAAIRLAVNTFRAHLTQSGTEDRFIPHGSTWFNNWRDWVGQPPSGSPRVTQTPPKAEIDVSYDEVLI